ncbi:MAG: undecaprenyl-diphosphate phosphatase, partial [Opitutus sp.]
MKPSPVRKFFLFLVMLLAPLSAAQTSPGNSHGTPPAPAPARPLAELSTFDAIILGVVEGITEFLPISSTGHLVIATRLLGLDSDTPLAGAGGAPMWFRPPSVKNPAGVPLTLKLAADTFTIVVQFGAIAAVALLYWSQLIAMLRGLLGRDPAGLRLLVNVLVAFLPAAVLGLIASDWIDAHLMSTGTVILALIVGAALMLHAERWRKRRPTTGGAVTGTISDLRPLAALKIGLWQCLAMWPGMSRSMTTIVGGYFAGL